LRGLTPAVPAASLTDLGECGGDGRDHGRGHGGFIAEQHGGQAQLLGQFLARDNPLVFLGGLGYGLFQLVGTPRLGHVSEHVSLVDRRDHRLDVGEAGEEYADGIGVSAP